VKGTGGGGSERGHYLVTEQEKGENQRGGEEEWKGPLTELTNHRARCANELITGMERREQEKTKGKKKKENMDAKKKKRA